MAKKAHAKARQVRRAARLTAPAVKAVKPWAVGGVCAGCGYWDALNAVLPAAALGRCRANPPALLTGTASGATAEWPITRAADWCGEWVAK